MVAVLGLVLVALGSPGHAEFTCAAGNTGGLIGAIHAAEALTLRGGVAHPDPPPILDTRREGMLPVPP